MEAIIPNEHYIASLNIPYWKCDREDKEQLKMHLVCAMLCCPKQIEDDGSICAELVNMNMREVSCQYLDFLTVGRTATNYDKAVSDRIEKNLASLFQLPLFKEIVEMDEKAKFKPIPSASIKPLFERILRGGRALRLREGQTKKRKEKECNTPAAVYKAKVVCNFLLELIESERRHQGLSSSGFVDWQSVQKRYQEMFTNEDSEDRKLMEIYKTKYGMQFTHPTLNGDVIKNWTGRSTITKALSMPIFYKINCHNEQSTGRLSVGFGDNIALYDDEELKKAADAARAPPQEQTGRKKFKEERRHEQNNAVNEMANVIPLRQRQTQSTITSIFPDSASSPFATSAKLQTHNLPSWNSEEVLPKTQPTANTNEPQYIPTSANIGETSEFHSESEQSSNETGVYTDDELDQKEASHAPGNTDTAAPVISKQKSDQPVKPTSKVSLLNHSLESTKPRLREELSRMEDTVKPFRNPWEIGEEAEDLGSTTRAANDYVNPQSQKPSSSNVRHLSAFASCKNSVSVTKGRSSDEEEGEQKNIPNNLYERVRSQGKQQRHENKEFGMWSSHEPRFVDDHGEQVTLRVHLELIQESIHPCNNHIMKHSSSDKRVGGESTYADPVRNQTNTYGGINRPLSPVTNRHYNARHGEYCEDIRDSNQNRARDEWHRNDTYGGSRRGDNQTQHRHEGHAYDNERYIGNSRDTRTSQPKNDSAHCNDTYSGNTWDYDKRWARNENSYRDDIRNEGSFRNDPLNKSSCRNDIPRYIGRTEQLYAPYNDRGGLTPSRQSDPHLSERHTKNNYNTAQYAQGNDGFYYNERRDSGGFRSPYITPLLNTIHEPGQSYSRNEGDPSCSFRSSSRQSFRNDKTQNVRASQDECTSGSSMKLLTAEQKARLRIIRDITFLNRNFAYRSLQSIFKILPPDDSVNWVALIEDRLSQVELANLKDKEILLIWNDGTKSHHSGDKSFDI
ncbi:hypothetical protein RB195_006864 [Necator americanus]|uniref:Uncharacterized protein n=1 Tax=Necator americanus TaxID=51031 RepID=A0ABR1BXH6_NECAM